MADTTLNETPLACAAEATETRRDRRTARTRQAIFDAARELINEQGYGHTTIDQIADRADVAPRTFFRHFASKEAVLFAHFEEHRRLMVDLIRARPADEHPFRAALEGFADFCGRLNDERDSILWAFRVMDEHDLHYEQSVLKAQTCDRVAEAIAERLGVDPATDPRPHVWALIGLTLFGTAMKQAFRADGTGDPQATFTALVDQTADCFQSACPGHPA